MVAAGQRRPGLASMQERERSFWTRCISGCATVAGFDEPLDMLCDLFEVPSAALLDFDAARPEVSAQGLGRPVQRRDPAALPAGLRGDRSRAAGIHHAAGRHRHLYLPPACRTRSQARDFLRRVLSSARARGVPRRNAGVGERPFRDGRPASVARPQAVRRRGCCKARGADAAPRAGACSFAVRSSRWSAPPVHCRRCATGSRPAS